MTEDYRRRFDRAEGQSDPLNIEENIMKPLKDAAETTETLNDIYNALEKVEQDKTVVEFVRTGYWIYKVDYNERLGKPQVLCFSYRGGYVYNGEQDRGSVL